MNTDIFTLLAKYNKEANVKMNEVINSLSEEEWNKEFPGYYKSVHELCSHLFLSDYRWLKRAKAVRTYKSLSDEYFSKDYHPDEIAFSGIAEYIQKRQELDEIMAGFVNELTENDLEQSFEFTNKKGITVNKKLRVYLLHLSHHETHHRGMISLYLEMLGKENDYSSLYPYG